MCPLSKQIPYVQWIVLRKDLIDELKWPRGAAIAQACHASTAAIWKYKDEANTLAYMKDINRYTYIFTLTNMI